MRARLITLAASLLLLLLPLQACWAVDDYDKQGASLDESELPAALADDDSFDELPFQQLRQALREEVEYGSKKGLSPRSSKHYNLLIR